MRLVSTCNFILCKRRGGGGSELLTNYPFAFKWCPSSTTECDRPMQPHTITAYCQTYCAEVGALFEASFTSVPHTNGNALRWWRWRWRRTANYRPTDRSAYNANSTKLIEWNVDEVTLDWWGENRSKIQEQLRYYNKLSVLWTATAVHIHTIRGSISCNPLGL